MLFFVRLSRLVSCIVVELIFIEIWIDMFVSKVRLWLGCGVLLMLVMLVVKLVIEECFMFEFVDFDGGVAVGFIDGVVC